MTKRRPRVAITLGDPRGIGPEVVAKVLADPPADVDTVLIGPLALMEEMPAGDRIGVDAEHPVAPSGRSGLAMYGGLTLDLPPAEAGRLAGRAVERAVQLALAGDVDAIVTAPIEKHALKLAGYQYAGHTEWLGALAGVDVAMMLIAKTLRVVLVTTHLGLRDALAALSIERVLTIGHVTRLALESWWAIEDPRLALCAVNPHAGEGGLFGDEEARILTPAAEELGAAGPLPADTVFVRALQGEFDAVLAPYHDVGMTAVKVAGFGSGVNVTLGLPFVRTAPDHGTALDIAGQGLADQGSFREAFTLAVELAAKSA